MGLPFDSILIIALIKLGSKLSSFEIWSICLFHLSQALLPPKFANIVLPKVPVLLLDVVLLVVGACVVPVLIELEDPE